MATWRTVMAYKKFSIMQDLDIGVKYNIEELTGKSFKNNPKVFFTISEIGTLNSISYHVKLNYIIEYPYITFYNEDSKYSIKGKVYAIIYERGGDYYE